MLVNQRVCTQMPREKVGLGPWVAGGKPALWTRHGCCDPRPSCQEELPSVTHIPCLSVAATWPMPWPTPAASAAGVALHPLRRLSTAMASSTTSSASCVPSASSSSRRASSMRWVRVSCRGGAVMLCWWGLGSDAGWWSALWMPPSTCVLKGLLFVRWGHPFLSCSSQCLLFFPKHLFFLILWLLPWVLGASVFMLTGLKCPLMSALGLV